MLRIHFVGFGGVKNMINIQRVSLKSFRNIDVLDLVFSKITSILSVNSFGKSNLLNGIDFGIDFITKSVDVRKDMMCWAPAIPYNKNIKKKEFCFEIEFDVNFDKDFYRVLYGYSFSWSADEKKPGKILNEYLSVKEKNKSQKFKSYIKRDKKISFYKPSTSGQCNKEIKIGDMELIINKLKAYDDLFYINIVETINDIKIYIDRHFDSNKNFAYSPFAMKENCNNGLLNENSVPRILNNIKNNNPDKFELIINSFKDLFPFITDLKVDSITLEPDKKMDSKLNGSEPFSVASEFFYLYVKDKNLSGILPFEFMSDGAKRILSIFTYLTLAEINNYPLVAVEEPENSVNPRLMQQYLIALSGFLNNSKLIITSHSPHLINYINPSNIYLGIPNDLGIAKFSKIKDSLSNKVMRDADQLSVLSGDYLFDLMSGTGEDVEVLASYVE